MSPWHDLFQPPAEIRSLGDAADWFARIADRLLRETELVIAERTATFAEIEFYYWSEQHADPFAHRHALQQTLGRWYFHRAGESYRGGTFKGLDLTFGDGTAYGGVLIRSLKISEGTIIAGPCNCVDFLLQATGDSDVRGLDERIGERPIWDTSSPLHLRPAELREDCIYQTPRVGLALKGANKPAKGDYVFRGYRFLTDPKQIKKGRPHLVLALHLQGHGKDEIRRLTGSPRASIGRYLDAFRAGGNDELSNYFDQNLSADTLCRMYGSWHAAHDAHGRD